MNSLVTSFLMLVILTAAASCSSPDDRQFIPDGDKVLESKLFAGITDSIRRDPGNVQLLMQRAMRLSQHNHHKTASADYKKVYELTDDPGVALEYSANLLLASDEREALYILEQGKKKYPENAEFSRRLAEIYVQNRLYNKALAEYELMLGQDSSNFEAWFERGNLLIQMRDTAAAIESFEKSFSIVPVNYCGMALANIYVAKQDPRTLEICDILIVRDTAGVNIEPVYMKGVFYAETKQFDKALQQFDECIRRDWKMTDAYIEKGIIHYERKKFQEALKVFNLAATVSNTDPDTYFWMGRCYEAMGETDDAATNYRRAVSLDNSFVEAKEALRRLRES